MGSNNALEKARRHAPLPGERLGFVQGVVFCAAWLIRGNAPAKALVMLEDAGVTLEDVRNCGAQEEDAAPVRVALGARR